MVVPSAQFLNDDWLGIMTPERYQQIGRLYQTALAREPAQRDPFLAAACGKDEALRRKVASLMAARLLIDCVFYCLSPSMADKGDENYH
jgi:hypothetical protein